MFSASLRCVPSFVFASHYLRAVTIFVSFLGIFLTGLSTSSLDLMQSIFLSFPLMELSKMQTTHYSPLTKPSVHSLLPLNLGPKSLACPGYHIGPVSPFLSGPYPITPDNWPNDGPAPLTVVHVCDCGSSCQNVLLSACLPGHVHESQSPSERWVLSESSALLGHS